MSRIWLVNIPYHIQWHHWHRFWLVNFPHHHPQRPAETTHRDPWRPPMETTHGDYPQRPPMETTHWDHLWRHLEFDWLIFPTTFNDIIDTDFDWLISPPQPIRPMETTHGDLWRPPTETTHGDHLWRHLEFDWLIFPTTFNDIIGTDFDWLISPPQPIRSLGLNNLIVMDINCMELSSIYPVLISSSFDHVLLLLLQLITHNHLFTLSYPHLFQIWCCLISPKIQVFHRITLCPTY